MATCWTPQKLGYNPKAYGYTYKILIIYIYKYKYIHLFLEVKFQVSELVTSLRDMFVLKLKTKV